MNPQDFIPYLAGPISGLILLASCSTSQDVPPRAIPAPIQTAAVSPLVDQAKADAAKGGEVSARLESRVEALQATTSDLRQGISAATSEADRLRKQKAATEKELDGLWQMLTGAESRAAALFAEVEKAKTIADEQKAQRVVAERRLDELAKAAIANDIEKQELRTQRDSLASELAKSEDLRRKAEMRAAVGTYLKGCIWFIGISLLLALLFYILTKLRIL